VRRERVFAEVVDICQDGVEIARFHSLRKAPNVYADIQVFRILEEPYVHEDLVSRTQGHLHEDDVLCPIICCQMAATFRL
jgi:anaerobic glycerol-3-phosphate dehydrogenase